MKPAPRGPGPVAAPPTPPDLSLHLFNAFLFLAGMGGVFFRMARDNDDLVRMSLVLAAGAGLTFPLVSRGARLPLSLVLPALGWIGANWISSFFTVNPGESLKEWLKIGVYALLVMTLAGAAPLAYGTRGREARRGLAFVTALAGLWLGWIHTPARPDTMKQEMYFLAFVTLTVLAYWPGRGTTGPWRWAYLAAVVIGGIGLNVAPGLLRPYTAAVGGGLALWSGPQVIASLGTTLLWGTAFILFLEAGTVRESVIRGLGVMAVVACAVGFMQFYGLDQLRPWDPPQPYDIWLADPASAIIAPLSKGVYRWDEATQATYLVVPRILGIYGNPNFFAPYLMQFMPLAIASLVLEPGRRLRAAVFGVVLIINLGMTEVAGAYYAIVLASPFLGTLLGWVSGPLPPADRPRMMGKLVYTGVATLLLGILTRASHDIVVALFLISLGTLLGMAGYLLARVHHERFVRVATSTVLAGTILLGSIGGLLYASGYKRESIEERLVKQLMAGVMWRHQPVIGVGLNAYKSWYPVIQQETRMPRGIPFEKLGSSFTQENRTHNDLAQMLAETGVLGGGMFAWLVFTIIAGGVRRLRTDPALPDRDRARICGLTGCLLVVLIYTLPNFPFHIVSSAGTFWVIAGLLASYHPWFAVARPDPGSPFPPLLRRALVTAGAGSVFIMGVFSVHLFDGTLAYKRAEGFWRNQRSPDIPSASAQYERALHLDPFNAQYTYDYGALCFNAGSQLDTSAAPTPAGREQLEQARDMLVGKARRLLSQARDLGFVNEDLEYGLGHVSEIEAQRHDALARAAAARPGRPRLKASATETTDPVESQLEQRDAAYGRAIEHYTRALGLNERHEASRQGRLRMLVRGFPDAEVAFARGEWKKARVLYREAVKRHPDNHLALLRYGTLCVTPFGDLAEGLPYLEKAARLAHNDANVWLMYGRALVLKGDLEHARRVVKVARSLDWKYPESRDAEKSLDLMIQQRDAAGSTPAQTTGK